MDPKHTTREDRLGTNDCRQFQVDASAPTAKPFSFLSLLLSHIHIRALSQTSTYKLRSILHLGTSEGNWSTIESLHETFEDEKKKIQNLFGLCRFCRCFDYHLNFCTESENLVHHFPSIWKYFCLFLSSVPLAFISLYHEQVRRWYRSKVSCLFIQIWGRSSRLPRLRRW